MKKLSTWLIILGILICLIPIGGRLYIHYQQNKMYSQYVTDLENKNSQLSETFEVETTSTHTSITTSGIEPKKISKPKIENIIGRIAIPSISSDQLLLEGSDSKQLKYGAGHIIGTSFPGEIGNCSIAGHRNYTFGSYFNRLDEVNVEDDISIKYKNSNYIYKVTEIFVVEPDDISVLINTPEVATITLITCHPKGSNSQRLIVKGVLQ